MNQDVSKDVKKILGYGEKIEVFVGVEEVRKENSDEVEKKEKFEIFHVCPTPLEYLGELGEAIEAFSSQDNLYSPETKDSAIKIIQYSLIKAHGMLDAGELSKKFDLHSALKMTKIAISVNDFLAEMEEIKKMNQEEPKKN